jgi:hypothetical protein
MRGPALFAATLLAAISVTACATMNVGSYRATGFEPAHYRTWDWAAPDAIAGGDTSLAANGVFRDHLEGAMEKQFAAHKLFHVVDGAPDVWVHYHAYVDRRLDMEAVDAGSARCSDGNCGTHVVPFDAGTIVVDVVDARTNVLLWRGWAEDSVTGVLEDHDLMTHYVKTAVRKIMERFPEKWGS